jgi:hypothetical protein
MVTLILLFIFSRRRFPAGTTATSRRPSADPLHPIQVIGNDGQGVIVTVQASDASLDLHTDRPTGGQEGSAQGHRAGHRRRRVLSSIGRPPPTPRETRLEGLGPPLSHGRPQRPFSAHASSRRKRASNQARKLMRLNQTRLATVIARLLACRMHRPPRSQDDQQVLDRLDAAAANFHSTSADVEFDTIKPIPSTTKTSTRAQSTTSAKGLLPDGRPLHPAQRQPSPRSTPTPAALEALRKAHRPGHDGQQSRKVSKATSCSASAPAARNFPIKWTSNTLGPEKIAASRPKSWNWSPKTRPSARIFPR